MRRFKAWKAAALVVAIISGVTFLKAGGPPVPAEVTAQQAQAPDPDDRPIPLRIWYPTHSGPERSAPLIAISHGAGGSSAGHVDTAIALAKSGFVVVAVEHTGDNYHDQSYVERGANLDSRPRHISRAIDYMLNAWPNRITIDQARIGVFGHSAGGFTALVLTGGEPDLSRRAVYCREQPEAWTCRYLRRHGAEPTDVRHMAAKAWVHDARVKAIAISAPALGYTFDRTALANVKVPVLLWAAGKDAIVEGSPATIRQALTAPTDYRFESGAGHFAFLTPCSGQMRVIITVMHWLGTEDICADPPGFDRTRFHDDFNRSVISFFTTTLKRGAGHNEKGAAEAAPSPIQR